MLGQYFGQRRPREPSEVRGQHAHWGLIAGLLFAAGILLLGAAVADLLQSPTLEEATAYPSICGVGLLFIFVYNSSPAILRGVGNSRILLYCIIASGEPQRGAGYPVRGRVPHGGGGAALATVDRPGDIPPDRPGVLPAPLDGSGPVSLRYLRPEAEMVKRTLKLGFRVALQWTIASISWLVVPTLIIKYGVTVSAGKRRAVQQNPRLLPALPLRPDHRRG